MRYTPIDPELFVLNRRQLASRLKPNSLAVLNSNDPMPTNADGTHPFVQQTDLFYLCGVDQEESTLVIYPDARDEKHKEILFLRETNEQIALWEGKKYTREEACRIAGIQNVCWNNEFELLFKTLALQADAIYLNSNEHLRSANLVETRDMRFFKWCRQQFPLHTYQRLAPVMHELRAIKSAPEVEQIQRACDITAKTFRRLLGFIQPGVWEFEIEAEIVHEFLRNRSRGPAYESIVASGSGACTLHYTSNHNQCRDGDLVLIDFGAEYANYAADVTRTVPVSGKFSERQRAVYDAVLHVQKTAIELLQPGTSPQDYLKEVGHAMESELIRLGLLDAAEVKQQPEGQPLYRKYFPHGISHHLGLDVHDYGDKDRRFEAGMVFTCEPGIYIQDEGIGIRIENDILITADGPRDLTEQIPREAVEIEALMQK
jgi:Xaa-Pro aminopeptidase